MRTLAVLLLSSLFSLPFGLFAQDQPIVLHTATGDIQGSLLAPEKVKKPPVILIIAGSGPTNRDATSRA